MNFEFYTGAARPGSEAYVMNPKAFILDLSEANKAKIKALHDQLVEKRINTIAMPACTDNSNLISNKEGFEKYGKFLKYVQTEAVGNVTDPKWPHPVIGQSTGGWAAVQKPDESVELLPVGLYKATGQSVWSFTSLNSTPDDYDLSGNSDYKAARGEFGGFLMKKENVAKCSPWE